MKSNLWALLSASGILRLNEHGSLRGCRSLTLAVECWLEINWAAYWILIGSFLTRGMVPGILLFFKLSDFLKVTHFLLLLPTQSKLEQRPYSPMAAVFNPWLCPSSHLWTLHHLRPERWPAYTPTLYKVPTILRLQFELINASLTLFNPGA